MAVRCGVRVKSIRSIVTRPTERSPLSHDIASSRSFSPIKSVMIWACPGHNVGAPHLWQGAESSGNGVFGVWPDVRRSEAQHDIAFGDARLFQTFGDSQIGV